MTRQNTQPIVPRLRFPEFKNSPGCRPGKLSDLLFETKKRNRKLKYDKTDVLSVSGDHGCVNQIEFMGRSYAGVSVKDYHIVETGDIVYTKSPLKKNPFGIIKQNKIRPGVVSTLYAVYRTTDIGNPNYIEQYFERDYNLNSYLQPIVRKGPKNDMKVKNSDVLTGTIWIPEPEEQKKIAECLGSLDDLIAAHGARLAALQDHKKGLLQQLFPAQGQTTPSLRFPEFQNAGEWVKKKISDLGKVVTGSTPKTSKREYYGGEKHFVSPADITELRFIEKTKTTLTEEGFAQTRHIKAESILFVCIGSTVGKVAQNTVECATNQQINSVIPDSNNWNSFVYYLLSKHADAIAAIAGKQAVPIINKSLFSSVELLVPEHREQQRIADCLSSLDGLIAAQAEQIAALKEHKRGLMQQLFPNPELNQK